jgi:hypothetical protein
MPLPDAQLPNDLEAIPLPPQSTQCARRAMVVTPGSRPPPLARQVTLVALNAQIAAAGNLMVNLGQGLVIPLYINPPGSITTVMPIFQCGGDNDHLALDEMSLNTPLTGGNLFLIVIY